LSALVVDDVMQNREVMRKALMKSMSVVDEAEDGLLAIEKVKEFDGERTNV